MFECIHQLAKDEQERANNVDEGREKELTKRVEQGRNSMNGFMSYKAACDTYNLAQEKNDSPERRNYWDVSHIPNQNVRKLFITTFGPEKSGILGKNKEIQVAYLTDREKMGISFTKLQVDAFLDKLEIDVEAVTAELERLYPDAQPMEEVEPMEEPHPSLARASDKVETSADESVPVGASESTTQEPLLHVIAEDGRPIELLIERS